MSERTQLDVSLNGEHVRCEILGSKTYAFSFSDPSLFITGLDN